MASSNPQATTLVPAAATSIIGLILATLTGGVAGLILFGYMMIIWLSLVTPILAAALLSQRRSVERKTSLGRARLQVVGASAIVVAAAFVLFPTFSFLVTAVVGLISGTGWSTTHFTTENALIWWRGGAPIAALYLAALTATAIFTTRTGPTRVFKRR